VYLGPGLRRELGVEGLPDQRVPKPVHLAHVPARPEQADSGGLVAEPGNGPGPGTQDSGDQGRVDTRAQRRCSGQHLRRGRRAVAVCGGGEPGNLAADGLPDAGRDGNVRHGGCALPEQPGDLGDEQRVPVAAALDVGDHAGVRTGQQEPDVPVGQARQGQRGTGRLQCSDHIADLRVQRRLRGAVGGDQQDPGQPCGGREPHEQRRGPARSVQVIKDYHQRHRPRRPVQHRAYGLEQREPGPRSGRIAAVPGPAVPGPGIAGRAIPRPAAAEFGEQRGEQGGLRSGRPGERLRPGLPAVAAQHLHPGPVGRSAAVLPCAAPQHERAVGRGHLGEGAGQPGLPDARLARHQHQPAVPGRRLAQRGAQHGELAGPADERLRVLRPRWLRHARHLPRPGAAWPNLKSRPGRGPVHAAERPVHRG
jgi:hypothetical protein